MVNKKLMTSLFNVRFKLEKDGCALFKDLNGVRLGEGYVIPVDQHKYITDKVAQPTRSDNGQVFPTLIYAGNTDDDLLVYTFDWSVDGVTPWDFNNNTVEKDLELKPCNWVEKKWKIEFDLVATSIAGGSLVIDSACTKEALPATIENISNGKTVTSTAANNYASDYTKNRFKYSTTGSDLHYVMRNATGNSCKWVDQYGNAFYFGSTKVYKDLKLHMEWVFKTWPLTIDYNTGSGRYSNDLTASYSISRVGTFDKAANAIITRNVEDNFTVNTSPTQASAIASYLDGITSRFSGAGVTVNVRVSGWYNQQGRSTAFDRAGFKITAAKTIYAKWVNSATCNYYRYTSNSYNSNTWLTDWWSTEAGTYTTPSFCPTMTATVMGAGGNSNYFSGNRATGAEYFEITICNPGGSATASSATWSGDASKLAFNWLAMGSSTSYSNSYIQRGNWVIRSYRGSGGGSREYERYNLTDRGDEEKIAYGKSVVGYFAANGGAGKYLYTQIRDGYSSRSNTGITTQFRFMGYCSSWAKNQSYKCINIYLQAWFYYNGTYWYPGDLYLGNYVYHVVDSDNSNNDIWGWEFLRSSGWTGYAWWWTCGSWGNGGQCLFFSTQTDTKSYPNQCYGHGGYVGFNFPAQ